MGRICLRASSLHRLLPGVLRASSDSDMRAGESPDGQRLLCSGRELCIPHTCHYLLHLCSIFRCACFDPSRTVIPRVKREEDWGGARNQNVSCSGTGATSWRTQQTAFHQHFRRDRRPNTEQKKKAAGVWLGSAESANYTAAPYI